MRNLARSHRLAAGFKAAGLKWTGPSAASFTVWRFDRAACLVTAAGLSAAACFGGLLCLGDLPCFEEPLNKSDSQPAWLTLIGINIIAAATTITMPRRDQNPEAIRPRIQMNPRRFMLPSGDHHNSRGRGAERGGGESNCHVGRQRTAALISVSHRHGLWLAGRSERMMTGMPDTNATFWQTPLAELTRQLGADINGLTSVEAAERLQRYGANRLDSQRGLSLLRKVLSRFRNPLVLILLAAATVSAFTGDIASLVIISAMVLFSVLLDSVQEYRAEQAADQLKISVALQEQALRDGREITVRADQLVPGDVVVLAAGDLVPADGRVIEARDFFVNEGLLTGESYPVEKRAVPEGIVDINVAQATNAAFMGTSVISGSAKLLLCATGDRTQLGEISATLRHTPPPAALEKGVYEFGILIVRLTILLVLFVLLVNTLSHRPLLESFLFAIALAVGLTPELLPMIVSVTLARGAIRMAKQKVIVKRLAAIEDLGSMDVLCTDKTGTLTES